MRFLILLLLLVLVVVVANAFFTERVVGGWPWSTAATPTVEEKKAETCSPITNREMMAIKNISNPCPINDANKKVIDASLEEIRKSENFTDSFKKKSADMVDARNVKESPERISKDNKMIVIDDKTKEKIVNQTIQLNENSYVSLAVKFDKKGGRILKNSDQKVHHVKIAVIDLNDLAKYGNDKLVEKYKQSCDMGKSREVSMTVKEEGSCKNDLSLTSVKPQYIIVVYCVLPNGELYLIHESQIFNNINNCSATVSIKNDFAHVFQVTVENNNTKIFDTKDTDYHNLQ